MSRRPPSILSVDSRVDNNDDLVELMPSPIPDSPVAEKFTSSYSSYGHVSPPHQSSSSNLGIWLARSQRYSSYAFTSFLGLHFTTTSLVPLSTLSITSGSSSLLLARVVYQSSPLLETLLIPGSLAVHIFSGLAIRIRRHRLAAKRYGAAPKFWSRSNFSGTSIAGWLLLPMLTAHAVVTRVVPLWVDGDSSEVGLEYVGHGFAYHGRLGWWLNSAYYVGFVGVASWHVVHGFCKYFRIRSKRRANIAVALLSTAWLGGLFAVIARAGSAAGYLGQKYDSYYATFFGRLGPLAA